MIPDSDYEVSIYGARQKQRSVERKINFHTVPRLTKPTEFTVNYTTPVGALLIWNMAHLAYIDGFEVHIFNKDIFPPKKDPIKVRHIPNTQTRLLLSDLHWETKYKIVMFAVRGKDTTDKVEVSFKTEIYVQPIYMCELAKVAENGADVRFKHKAMKKPPKIIYKYTMDDTSIAKEKAATKDEQSAELINVRQLQASTNYTIEVNTYLM